MRLPSIVLEIPAFNTIHVVLGDEDRTTAYSLSSLVSNMPDDAGVSQKSVSQTR